MFLLSLAGLCAKAESTPQWVSDLLEKNKGLIDSIHVYPLDPKAPHLTTYIIYYNQPMKHAVVDSPRFHMRALLTVDNKVIENGQIYILRNNRKYTMSGIEVK